MQDKMPIFYKVLSILNTKIKKITNKYLKINIKGTQ